MKELGNGFEKAVKELKKVKAKRIFIQFPEGLKLSIQEISAKIGKEGFETVLCMERTYGSCDLRDDEAKRLKCDVILHIAHQDYGVKSTLPVVYWDYFIESNPLPILEKEIAKLKGYKRIGLVTSLQFVKTIPVVTGFLEKNGKKVFVHKSLQYSGQMLGCKTGAGSVIEKNVDAFLCISAGKFYPIGLALSTKKPLLSLDLETQTIYSVEPQKKKIEKIIAWNKQELKDAKNVGLLLSWKKGQMFGNPFKMKENLEKQGKKVFILAFDEFSNDKIEGLKLDIIVSFACPRIGTDDLERAKIPLINWYEVESKI
jgi:2-(3-amino-3-carboxypropyl)histidine synthase